MKKYVFLFLLSILMSALYSNISANAESDASYARPSGGIVGPPQKIENKIQLFNSDGKKTFYDLIYDALERGPVDDTYKVTVEVTPDNCSDFDKYNGIAFEEATDKAANDTFKVLGEHPEFFYYHFFGTGDDSLKISVEGYENEVVSLDVHLTFNKFYTDIPGSRAKFQGEIDKINALFDKSEYSPLQKEKLLHDYLVENCEYDKRVTLSIMMGYDEYPNPPVYDPTFTMYGALIENGAGVPNSMVCQGYAETIYYFLNQWGINCMKVESNMMNHMWNLVELNGKWYHLDATWDDPTPPDATGKVHFYQNFNRDTEEFISNDPQKHMFSESGADRNTYNRLLELTDSNVNYDNDYKYIWEEVTYSFSDAEYMYFPLLSIDNNSTTVGDLVKRNINTGEDTIILECSEGQNGYWGNGDLYGDYIYFQAYDDFGNDDPSFDRQYLKRVHKNGGNVEPVRDRDGELIECPMDGSLVDIMRLYMDGNVIKYQTEADYYITPDAPDYNRYNTLYAIEPAVDLTVTGDTATLEFTSDDTIGNGTYNLIIIYADKATKKLLDINVRQISAQTPDKSVSLTPEPNGNAEFAGYIMNADMVTPMAGSVKIIE